MFAKKRHLFYFTVCLLLQCLQGFAQVKCKIEHYGAENGLSHNNVTSIIKSSDGFMWFSTWDGINRFDGRNFITYKSHPGDSLGMPTNRIDRIVEDQSGYLWLKPNDLSVSRFNKKTTRLLSISDLLAKAKITNIKFDKIIPAAGEKVWLTTTDKGVFCVNNAAADIPSVDWYATGKIKKFELPSNTVIFLFEDKEHKIWIGTDKGLCVFSVDEKGNYNRQDINVGTASAETFVSIAEEKERIWIGTQSGTLVYYEKSSGRFINKKIAGSQLNTLCLSAKNKVLYASTAASEIISVHIPSMVFEKIAINSEGGLYSIYEDRSGLLWIEPETKGIIKYNPLTKTSRHFIHKSDVQLKYPVKLFGVFEDNEDRVWVMMGLGGFGYYNPARDEVEYFYDEPGSPDRKFSNIIGVRYFDPSGIFWFTTSDRGIEKVIFQHKDLDPKLLVEAATDKADNEVRGIYNDHKKRAWIASKSGALYIQDYDGKRLANFFINEPKAGIGAVYTILEDKQHRVWLGTKGNGLFMAAPEDSNAVKYKLYHYLPDKNDRYSISSNTIYSLLEDKYNRIWLGTFDDGLNLVKENSSGISFINSNNELTNYPNKTAGKIRYLFQDKEGRLWVAGLNGLLIADINTVNYKAYVFTSYHKNTGDKNSLANNDLQFIFQDSKNRIWIGTSGGGLNEAIIQTNKEPRFKAFTKKDGLPSDYVLSIVEDNFGSLWLGTENGLCKFNPDKLLFRNFDSYDGLVKSGFSEASGIKLSDGNLLFGMINGYLVFNPQTIANKKINAGMVFTNLQVNNKDIAAGEAAFLPVDINNSSAITLKYNENIISIDFTILDYRASDKQIFAYRLKGFDTDWNKGVNQHRATYTNLPPGNYEFEVKSLSDDLYEKLPFKTLSITILPPWWRTWWAYLLYAILLGILIEIVRRVVTTMIRLRNKVVVEHKLTALKTQFFTNISHELRTPLTLIINPIDQLIKQNNLPEKSLHYLTVARKNTNRMVRFINQLLDFQKIQNRKMQLKISNVEIVAFVKDISSYFLEAANEKQIELKITSNTGELFAWVDKEKIDIVIYNLLSNAFKFSPAGTTIEIQVNNISGSNNFTIAIVDQGMGVPKDKLDDIFELYYEIDKTGTDHLAGTGIGLALCKEIVQLHHGKISAQNNAVKGLAVTVELKTTKEHFGATEVIIDQPEKTLSHREASNNEMAQIPVAAALLTAANTEEMPVILIADDNTELREFLAGQLRVYFKVMEAANGVQAWEKAVEFLPDLILSDVMMPEMDGIALLDKLKNNDSTSHIPVVLLTARSSVESQIEGIRYGADYYLTKPFNADLIIVLISNLIKQRRKIFDAILSGQKEQPLYQKEILQVMEPQGTAAFITVKDRSFLEEVIAIVEKGMGDNQFNIDKVAEALLMGRSTFYKKLKSLTNLSPVEFIKEIRLKRSKELLDEGSSDIAGIAYEVGFSNAKYFSTCFKEKYNITPKEYLKYAAEKKAGL